MADMFSNLRGWLFGAEMIRKEYSPISYTTTSTSAVYSPTSSYAIDYTAPVIQIQSPQAQVLTKKEQKAQAQSEPALITKQVPQFEQKGTAGTGISWQAIGIIGAIALIGLVLLK